MITIKKNKTFSDLKDGERQARREIIIEAAERVFAVKPFNKISLREIAREAGITHVSIYRYFPDQMTLFVEAFLKGAQEIIPLVSDVIRESRNGDIEKVAEVYVSYLMEHDQYFRMMTHFMLDGTLSPELIERLNVTERQMFDELDVLFRKMKAPEPVRPRSHAFYSALNGVLISFRNYPGRTKEDVQQHIKKIAKIVARNFFPK